MLKIITANTYTALICAFLGNVYALIVSSQQCFELGIIFIFPSTSELTRAEKG